MVLSVEVRDVMFVTWLSPTSVVGIIEDNINVNENIDYIEEIYDGRLRCTATQSCEPPSVAACHVTSDTRYHRIAYNSILKKLYFKES